MTDRGAGDPAGSVVTGGQVDRPRRATPTSPGPLLPVLPSVAKAPTAAASDAGDPASVPRLRPYSLGVDLGTTSVAAALSVGGRSTMFSLGDFSTAMPSLAYLDEDGRVLCGEEAQARSRSYPERAASGFKRSLGDPTPLRLGKRPRSVEELLSDLLAEVLRVVTEAEGARPRQVVLTHSAVWGPMRLEMLKDVSRRAGVEETVLVREPVAAVTHYVARHEPAEPRTVAVYDLGGGTFEATVVRADRDGVRVLGRPEGVEPLGGLDFDEALFRHLDHRCDGALSAQDVHDHGVRATLGQIRLDCALAKERLSRDKRTVVPVFLPEQYFEVAVTREQFESLVRVDIESTIGALERAIRSAGLLPDQVDGVLLTGGSSRIPLVRRMLADRLDRPVWADVHPEYAVALGAASVVAAASAAIRAEVPAPVLELGAVGSPAPAPPDSAVAVPTARPRRSRAASRLVAVVAVAAVLAGISVSVTGGRQSEAEPASTVGGCVQPVSCAVAVAAEPVTAPTLNTPVIEVATPPAPAPRTTRAHPLTSRPTVRARVVPLADTADDDRSKKSGDKKRKGDKDHEKAKKNKRKDDQGYG